MEQFYGKCNPNAPLQKAMSRALKKSGIPKKATIHTLRHSFATSSPGWL
jgi:integrase